ncbi:DUF2345 domain-containing protein, partial [Burkholderia vietnamiensis]|uniref:DUF2345 domain-containing protein n=1 Tax=Burkholderia vietnamiensis TaxID=60552 RepID=UPI000A4F65A0
FTAAAGEAVSLFAQKLGIKIFAAKGPVEVQAHNGPMSLVADKDLTVTSVNGAVFVRAETELTLGSGGAFIQLKDENITVGGPLDLFLKVITIQQQGKAQMHLAAPAFSTTVVPFTFACDAWRRPIDSDNTESTQPTPKASDWNQLGNPAAVSAEAPAPRPQKQQPNSQPAVTTKPDVPSAEAIAHDARAKPAALPADNESAHEPKKPLADDAGTPIKLETPVVCDWHTPAFTEERTDSTETVEYYGLDSHKNAWPDAQTLSGAQLDTAFELSYDPEKKTLYAAVRVQVIPVELFKCDGSGKPVPGEDGKLESRPFDHDKHSFLVACGVDKPMNGYVMKYREGTGENFDINAKARQIEAVLNGHKSKLILNGCSRDAACGCRVSVVFKVNLLLSVKGEKVGGGKKIHKTIHLFPRTQRADSGSWGEGIMYPEALPDQSVVWKDMPYEANVIAHECGHLFNYPDEYWKYGGWVHEQYIKDKKLDFDVGLRNDGRETWQIASKTNVMGGGCNIQASMSDKASPSATVHPYYLEYIRRHFCELTGERKPVRTPDGKKTWRKWRVGYDV